MTALRWISEFIVYGKEKLLPYCAPILGAFLPSIAHQIRDILYFLFLILLSPSFALSFFFPLFSPFHILSFTLFVHVEEQAQRANSLLLQLLHETKEEFSIGEFLDTVTSQFMNKSVCFIYLFIFLFLWIHLLPNVPQFLFFINMKRCQRDWLPCIGYWCSMKNLHRSSYPSWIPSTLLSSRHYLV